MKKDSMNEGLYGQLGKNKAGLIFSIALLVSIFMPLVNMQPFGSTSARESGGGTLALLMIILVAAFFWIGVDRFILRNLCKSPSHGTIHTSLMS